MLDSLARFLRRRLKSSGLQARKAPHVGPVWNVAAVAENRPPYAHEILFLFKSLLVFGGQAARCTKIAYFIDAIGGDVAEELAKSSAWC
jgi:hypothetical protein